MSMMLAECLEAPQRVRVLLKCDGERYAALVEGLRRDPPPFAITVARGSSDCVASYAAYLATALTGRIVASLPPSQATLEHSPLVLDRALVLAISQSGESPDIVETVRAAAGGGGRTVAIVNAPASPLARIAHHVLDQHAGPERSVAATKSVLCSLAVTARLLAAWSADEALLDGLATLPDHLEAAAAAGLEAEPLPVQPDTPAFIVARGQGLAVAQEVALKLKETCGLHAEAFSAAELRHGPREIVGRRFLVLALALPGPGQEDVRAAARELRAQGARVAVIEPDAGAEAPHHRLVPLLALQTLYPVIARTAVALGRDPDRPERLAKVTRTT